MVVHNRLKKLFAALVVLAIIGIPLIGLLKNWWGDQEKLEESMFEVIFIWIINPFAIIVIGGVVIAFLWGIYRILLFLINRFVMSEPKVEQENKQIGESVG